MDLLFASKTPRDLILLRILACKEVASCKDGELKKKGTAGIIRFLSVSFVDDAMER